MFLNSDSFFACIDVPTEPPQTKPTERLATMQTTKRLQNSCNENIGALAGVTAVAVLNFIISVIIITTLVVANKRLKYM